MKIQATLKLLDGTTATVDATVLILSIPGWPEPITVWVHRGLGKERKWWTMTDPGTSRHITSKHDTQSECIAEGTARLARVGHAKYLRAVQVAIANR